MLGLLLAAFLIYAAIVAVMYASQTEMLFPVDAVGKAGPLPPGTEQLELPTADGDVLRGVHISPTSRMTAGRLLVMGFAGNGMNAANAAELLHEIYPDADVVAFYYRGYAPSTGAPSGKSLTDDAPLIYDDAVARIRPAQIVAVGLSVGSGVAASLSGKRHLDGLILVTPFDSLRSVAEAWYPWLPVRSLFKHQIDAVAGVQHSDSKVAIISAQKDELVPTARTIALKQHVRNLVFDREIAGAGHNDIYARPEFEGAMIEAMAAMRR